MITIRTEKGIGRTESEDTVLAGKMIITDRACCLPVPKQGFVCISDGVGGLEGGSDASRFLAGYLQAAPLP